MIAYVLFCEIDVTRESVARFCGTSKPRSFLCRIFSRSVLRIYCNNVIIIRGTHWLVILLFRAFFRSSYYLFVRTHTGKMRNSNWDCKYQSGNESCCGSFWYPDGPLLVVDY